MSVQVVKLERPNPRQEEFLKCEKKYVAFGGARGGGKSWAVRTKAVLMALKYPGIRILLVRRTMPELESNHLRFLRRQLAGWRNTRRPPGSWCSPAAVCWNWGTAPVTGIWTGIRGRSST